MNNHWKVGLFTLASVIQLSSASACRPRPSSLYQFPTATEGPLPVGDATSRSTWDNYSTVGQPVPSTLDPQSSRTWGVMPGSGNQESLSHGGISVTISHGTASTDGAHETGSVPIVTSWDGDNTTKEFSSLPISKTTIGVSVPAGNSGSGTNIDTASLTSGLLPSGTDTVDHSPTEGHKNETTQSLISSGSDAVLPNTSLSFTTPTLSHQSPSHGISEEIPNSLVGSVTSPVSEMISTTRERTEQTQDTDWTKTMPTDGQHTSFPTGSQSETDTSALAGPVSSRTFPSTFTNIFATDGATSTGPVESQDVTSANTEGDDSTISASSSATTISEDTSVPPVLTSTSTSMDDEKPSDAVASSSLEVQSSDTEDSTSLATATSDAELATKPPDGQTDSDVRETQAPVNTIPERTTITSPGTATGPLQATTIPADPKSTVSNDESLLTSSVLSKTQGQQTTVTGTDGETATWSAVRDPDLSDVSQTQTQTDDDGAIVVIFPGGWKWSPVGGGKKGGPTPTAVPTVEGDTEDDPDDEDDEEKCTSTRPPTCTMTMSYYTDAKGEGTSTRIGTCSPVTGCVLGEQSTTTTTVASDIPRITGFLSEDEDDVPPELLPADGELVEYYLDAFKRWGIADTDAAPGPVPEAECESGILVNSPLECLELFSGPFCNVVNEDETQRATRNFTFEDVQGKVERSLLTRQSLCASYVFNFDWTGADGDCKLSCSEAFGALKTQCTVPFWDRLAPGGTLDVGCGNYTYQANREALFDPSSSTLQPSTTPTTTTTTTTESSSTTTLFSTATPTSSTEEQEPTQSNAYFGVHNLQCNKVKDYPGHASVQEEALTFEINKACSDLNKKGWHMTPEDGPIEWEYKDYIGVKHRFTWSWKKDCTAENEDVDLGNPLNEDDGVESCVFIFGEAWSQCNNGGVGGSQDVGCVQYWLEAGI